MRRLLPFVAVAVASLAFAQAPFPRSRPGKDGTDLSRMQGTWTVVERTQSGRSVLTGPTQIKITGARFEFIVSGNVRSAWEMKLDPSASPRTMDRSSLKSPALAKGGGGGGIGIQGIYRFEGERLLMCYTQGGRGRPTAFDDKQGSVYLMILERAGR